MNARRDRDHAGEGQETGKDYESASAFSILLVCTGNVSRSPVAELLLESALTGDNAPTIKSAGTRADSGAPIDPEMEKRLVGRITSSIAFAAKPLDRELAVSADLILGMTREHCTAAVQLVPSAIRSTFTLEEFAWLLESITTDGPNALRGAGDRLRTAVPLAESRRVFFRLGTKRLDDIPDPIGRSPAVYDHAFDRISRAVATISKYATPSASS